MKSKPVLKQKHYNIFAWILAVAFVAVVIWGCAHKRNSAYDDYSDNIEQIDLDTIYLVDSGIEVNFAEILLSEHEETRKLITSTQKTTATVELTDSLIKKLDFDFIKKTQNISYLGTGYFVVDLDKLTSDDIIEDRNEKTITIRIGHAYLEAIEINPNNIIIDEVNEGLLARGDIKLTVKDYNEIEKALRTRLEEQLNTATNGQMADSRALKMVKDIYEPIVKAIDHRYSVVVEFK